MERLDGKVAIVFGAGPNNGGTIAHFMAKEGARIAVVDISGDAATATADFLKSRGFEAMPIIGDATDDVSVKQGVADAVSHYGYIDIMVNLAGRSGGRGLVTDFDTAQWKDGLANGFLMAGMLTTKYAAQAMVEAGRTGSMIHIISSTGHYGEPGNALYSAQKSGLLIYSRAAAMELAYRRIRVNTITPYAMEQNFWARSGPVTEIPEERPVARFGHSRMEILKGIPLERFPRSSDLASAAVFLASDESEFVTGIDIPVDGGVRTRYPSWRPGEYTGINVNDYLNNMKITRYGEPVEDYVIKE